MRLPTVLLLGMAIGVPFARPAVATEYTLTIAGTIDSGVDTSGVFGHAKASLHGAAYSLSITIDRDRTTFTDNSPYNLQLSGSELKAAFISATVNGVTYSQFAGTVAGTLYLGARNQPDGRAQGLAAGAEGTDTAGNHATAALSDTNPADAFVPNLTLNQAIQRTVRGTADRLVARFSLSGPRGTAQFSSANAVIVTYGVSDATTLVPDPRAPSRPLVIAHRPWHATAAWLRLTAALQSKP